MPITTAPPAPPPVFRVSWLYALLLRIDFVEISSVVGCVNACWVWEGFDDGVGLRLAPVFTVHCVQDLIMGDRASYASVPVALSLPSTVHIVMVSAGSRHSLALDINGSVYSWGWGEVGPVLGCFNGCVDHESADDCHVCSCMCSWVCWTCGCLFVLRARTGDVLLERL